MKIFAISGGRAKGNNEMLLRAALKAAQEVCDAEVEVVRIHDLDLKNCVGCETCMRGLTTGGDGKCVFQNDDMGWLTERIGEADGFIVTSPVYDLIPTGTMVNLVNRALGIGKQFQQSCRANPKVGAVISLGGSDWIDLTEPIVDLTLCNLSKSAVVVDRLIVGHNPAPSMVVLDNAVMERARRLGRNVGEALLKRAAGQPFGFVGDSGVCPVCHCNLLEMRSADEAVCPYCNAKARFVVEDGKVKLAWDPESVEKNRFTVYGETEHRKDIGLGHRKAAENRVLIQERIAALEDFGGSFVRPERRD